MLLALALMVSLLSACGQASQEDYNERREKYDVANQLWRDGEYLRAAALFEELGDYMDSATMVQTCYERYEAEQKQAQESAGVPSDAPQPESTPEPTETPDPTPEWLKQRKSEITANNPGLALPDDFAMLEEGLERRVLVDKGISIYMRYGPSDDYDHFATLPCGKDVVIYASQNGYSLVKTAEGNYGWCWSNYLPAPDNPFLYSPHKNAYLGESKTMYVNYDKAIYLCWDPYKVFAHFSIVKSGEVLTVYAVQNGFAYVGTSTGATGWVYSSYLADY